LQRQDFLSLLRDLAAHVFDFTLDEVDVRHVRASSEGNGQIEHRKNKRQGRFRRSQVIHRLVKMDAYRYVIGNMLNSGGGVGVIHMPTGWTITAIETALFVAAVLGLAGAGAWASVIS
jgi:hypothetical protein